MVPGTEFMCVCNIFNNNNQINRSILLHFILWFHWINTHSSCSFGLCWLYKSAFAKMQSTNQCSASQHPMYIYRDCLLQQSAVRLSEQNSSDSVLKSQLKCLSGVKYWKCITDMRSCTYLFFCVQKAFVLH